jgi:hypothetical protein
MIDFTGNYGLFTKLGLIGGFVSSINDFQKSLVNVKSPALVTRFTSNGKTKIVLGYIPAIDSQISTVSNLVPNVFIDVAESVLIDAVTSHDPLIPATVTDCLQELVSQMYLNNITVQRLLTTVASVSDDSNLNIVNVAMVNADGGVNQHTLAENLRLEVSADSYTGGAGAGNETFNVIAKEKANGAFGYDYPAGSGSAINVSRVNMNASASEGNSVTNGNFDLFDAATPTIPSNWDAVATYGTPGTHYLISANGVKFQNKSNIRIQQSAASAISAKKVYHLHFRFKLNSATVVSSGSITVDLVDSAGNTMVDNSNAYLAKSKLFNSITAGNLGVYQDVDATFVVGSKTPSTVFLRVMCNGTDQDGVTVELNRLVLSEMSQLYTGGPYISLLGLDSEPIYKGNRVNISLTKTLDNGSGTYTNNTFQVLFDRLFSTAAKGITLPYSTTPTVLDSLIA